MSDSFELNLFFKMVAATKSKHPNWRYGQVLFNVLSSYHPDAAEKIRSTKADPFYARHNQDPHITKFLEYINTLPETN